MRQRKAGKDKNPFCLVVGAISFRFIQSMCCRKYVSKIYYILLQFVYGAFLLLFSPISFLLYTKTFSFIFLSFSFLFFSFPLHIENINTILLLVLLLLLFLYLYGASYSLHIDRNNNKYNSVLYSRFCCCCWMWMATTTIFG